MVSMTGSRRCERAAQCRPGTLRRWESSSPVQSQSRQGAEAAKCLQSMDSPESRAQSSGPAGAMSAENPSGHDTCDLVLLDNDLDRNEPAFHWNERGKAPERRYGTPEAVQWLAKHAGPGWTERWSRPVQRCSRARCKGAKSLQSMDSPESSIPVQGMAS